MLTLVIIAAAFFIAWILTEADYGGLAVTSIIVAVFAVISCVVSCTNVPAEYTRVDSVSYMTEAGYIETLDDCDYYTDGIDYYEQNTDKADWVPFAPAEYVKVELPGKVVAWGSEDKVVSGPVGTPNHFCASCGNEFAEEDKFCGGCGTVRPESADTAQQFCTNCGNKPGEDDKFCGGCGAAVEAKK